ncbi:proteasome adapter and scaffold protein ECM29 [Prorops nasuta]|uniref:proteasome adapter and scaffold protein ECM29 n=1 Tax=Prorops nasuta TaxID=863751 RepID=UPI0034CF3753
MATATDEMTLLERVLIRLGSAETDEQLQAAVCKFLPPVLLKLSSTQEGVRKKVMELLIHINKRVKSRPQVQLPLDALLLQYQDPTASSFVINFTIIYIKIGFPRLGIEKQIELIPGILNAIEGKPVSHQDSLFLMIMPIMGQINIPKDPEKCKSFLGLQDKPQIAKQLTNFMLDILLLPYGSVRQVKSPQQGQGSDASQNIVAPPGLSDYAYKRVIGEAPPSAEKLEQMKLGIVKFLVGGFFSESDIFIHLIVAASDTRFSIANIADLELKKIVGLIDWSSVQLAASLYTLFLGSEATQKDARPETKRQPASTRIRLKLLHYLCHVTGTGFIIPLCIQVVFDSLYGTITNLKLKSLALKFTSNIVTQCSLTPLMRVAGVILKGMTKLISENEESLKSMAYNIIGQLAQRIPSLVNKDLSLVLELFDALISADNDLRRTIRDTLICMSPAFVLGKEDVDNIIHMKTLLLHHIESAEPSVRFVAMHYAAAIFPQNNVISRYILLLASGDSKQEISSEAKKALYGSSDKSKDNEEETQITFPEFFELVSFIYGKLQERLSIWNSKNAITGNKTLPYDVDTFVEIINYLRSSLAKSANASVGKKQLWHPYEYFPLIRRYLQALNKEQNVLLMNYIEMILMLSHVSADKISLSALFEVIGCTFPDETYNYKNELPWLRSLIISSVVDVRQLAAQIYALITANNPIDDFEKQIEYMKTLANDKTLEIQHGGLVALTQMIERKIRFVQSSNQDLSDWKTYEDTVKIIVTFLNNTTPLTLSAAIEGIGIFGKTYCLPVPDETTDCISKKGIVDKLLSILNNAKISTKIKQKAAISLGYLCIGENFIHCRYIVDKLISMAEDTKDIEIHLSIGDALVCCSQGSASPEHRDILMVLASEYNIDYSDESTATLLIILDKLLQISKAPHPNSRQASCVWLLTLLEHNVKRECMKLKLSAIHCTFIDFLSDDNDIIQDLAAKGLGLVYMNSSKEERDVLVSNILDQFMQGRKTVKQVTVDTKLFEEGELGNTPNRSKLSTYREICSLATELQRPDFVYYFMHLANQNVKWNSKKGAGFGFAAIANMASEELNKYLPYIIPKLYRYQFDPNPKIQQSMTSIWQAIIPSTHKAVEQYHKEILVDINENLTHHEWRVRISCCLALSDLLRQNALSELNTCAPELFRKLFRVMDDTHKNTRTAATNTTKILSKVCVKHCDPVHGKSGEKVLEAILPVLLDVGVANVVDTVREVSLQTVSQLITTAGALLKPSLIILIPALLINVGDSENPSLSYTSTMYGGTTDVQNTIDNFRVAAAKEHFSTAALTKCIQYIDANILKELMPKIIELIKSSIGFGTKIVCSHFLTHLSTHLKRDLQPFAGKILTALVNGLADRNIVVRKNNAIAIGHVVGSAKESSCEKLFNTLKTWYMEKEDESLQLAVGQTLDAINTHNQDILRNHLNIIAPLVFFAMHIDKTPENENTIELWTNLWNDITPGSEAGIRQNLESITNMLQSAFESASWTRKVQAANAVHTVAIKLGDGINNDARNVLLKVLIEGLCGRTWNGKERLLNALATLTCRSKIALTTNEELLSTIIEILSRESRKGTMDYRRNALKALAEILHELDVDKFSETYDIAQELLVKLSNKNEEAEEGNFAEIVKQKEENINVQETIYEVLGKAWPTNKETQDKYCVEFINHCQQILANSTRTVQVAILVALNLYVDRLKLFQMKNTEMTNDDIIMYEAVCGVLYNILRSCIGESKYTRIRKESLNIILCLSKKMLGAENIEQLDKVKSLANELLPELLKDNQPEIRMRVVDVKSILNI